MKKILYLIFALSAVIANAQVPQGIPYQAVARNSSGAILANQSIRVRFSIRDSIATGAIVFRETFNPTTTAQGLFNVNVGTGTVVSGTFSSINWGHNAKFMQVEMDPTGGTSYIDMGTQQMMSVPYALYAGSSSNSTGWDITGNTSLSPSTNFIGTADNNALRIRVNNTWAGELNPINRNSSFGINSGQATTTGYSNVAIGNDALFSNINGSNLVAIGDSALYYQNGGNGWNVAVGSKALFANTTGYNNTAIGIVTLLSNTTGVQNTALGAGCLRMNTTGTNNTGNGTHSLAFNTTGYSNTANGSQSLNQNTTGYNNTANGVQSLYLNTTGYYNTAAGLSKPLFQYLRY
jgi:hypothetical protein